ncbi:MAG TPA: AAA family ATPase [Methanospirillum sp.]|uniref:ATP-binding protein n=1 Tax=Methanospirillum sp. TaxID=45200 RepID=UPI002CBFFD9A|nr:AAA family ATPase [Methanospirillum sp.]HPY59541.1 AAA family ATPase [Methanospirillum sp.]
MPDSQNFPFTAIVGQEAMKLALLYNIIIPPIGGVLIRGEKGTAKSTAVRALASLLPERKSVKGCPFRCNFDDPDNFCSLCKERVSSGEELIPDMVRMRVVELPLSATEDRVSGTLDIEHAIRTGKRKFQPGILAEANGNILYVDEVNLLEDHLVDLLLDAAAMGVNYVEREGISFSHPARFLLVGTMNPEEGDLRPQLLDRFGLVVDVTGEGDMQLRKEIIRKRLGFEHNPKEFISSYHESEKKLRECVISAKSLADQIPIDDRTLDIIVAITLRLGVDGHRADLTFIRAAIASAALAGRTFISREDISRAAELSLPHRMYRRPFEEQHNDMKQVESWIMELYQDVS